MRSRKILSILVLVILMMFPKSFLLVAMAGGEFDNTGEISEDYGGYIYIDTNGKRYAANATKGTGDDHPAGGGAGKAEGSEETVSITKKSDESYSADISEERPVYGDSGSRTTKGAPKKTVKEHRIEGTAEITTYEDGSERVVITSEDKTVYTKDTFVDGTYVTRTEREYLPGELIYADGYTEPSKSDSDKKRSSESGSDTTKTEKKESITPSSISTPDTIKAGILGTGVETEIGRALAKGDTTPATGSSDDLRSITIDKSEYTEDGTVTAYITKTDAEGRVYKKEIKDSIDRWKDVPYTVKLEDGREVARPHTTTEYLRASVYEPETKEVVSTGPGSIDYTYHTMDGESHTIHYKDGDGTVKYYSVVTDEEGREVALEHTLRRLDGDKEEVTSLGYEWAVQNFTDESSPYYGRYVSRTQPIPSATRGGRDKGGLLPVGTGVFDEWFINYGEHKMQVTHYFNVDVYSEYESCDDTDCDLIEVYEYSYIRKNPPEYYAFRVPLVCLDCVPPARGVRVCIGGGCDCIYTEDLVCDDDHSTEKYLDIETHTELER